MELEAGGRRIARARTFGDVPVGEAIWYENGNGLAEIAVNQGRADGVLGLKVGDEVGVFGTRSEGYRLSSPYGTDPRARRRSMSSITGIRLPIPSMT